MPETPEQQNIVNQTNTDATSSAASATATIDPTPTKSTNESTKQTSTISMPDLSKLAAEQLGKQGSSIDLLKDVELNVKIELGRSKMFVEDVLKLSEGAIVELDKLAGDPVDVFVNERLIARGEVLVLNENFCVRINQIISDVV